jgi:hypothetical protein
MFRLTFVRLYSYTNNVSEASQYTIRNLESHAITPAEPFDLTRVVGGGRTEYFAIRKDLLNRLVDSEQRLINERSGSVRLSISY